LTLSASIIDKNTIRLTDFSNSVNIRKEMVQNPEESLWIHADEPEDIFQLQGVFGLLGAVLDFQPNGVKGLSIRTTLRVSYFTKISDLSRPQEARRE
jgi:hypothetical protein